MPDRRWWIRRRRRSDEDVQGARPDDRQDDLPAGPAEDPHAAVWPPTVAPRPPEAPAPAPPFEPPADVEDDTSLSPLARARRNRMIAAAGIDAEHELSHHGRAVLDWLARHDDAICSGIVELVQATSLATIRHRDHRRP